MHQLSALFQVKLVGALADIDYVGLVKFSHTAQTVGSSVPSVHDKKAAFQNGKNWDGRTPNLIQEERQADDREMNYCIA